MSIEKHLIWAVCVFMCISVVAAAINCGKPAFYWREAEVAQKCYEDTKDKECWSQLKE